MIALLDVAGQLLADVLRLAMVALRPTRIVAAENPFLRRQPAMYVERGVKPRRPDVATRVSLALFSRLFEWRTSLVVVRPETLIRWHRVGFRLLWRWKSRPGRPAALARQTSSCKQLLGDIAPPGALGRSLLAHLAEAVAASERQDASRSDIDHA